MPLTDVAIRTAKPGEKPIRLYDTGGLYLELAPAGGKWWRLKYRFGGRERRLSLGTYPDTGLKEARQRRDDARRLLAEGVDPSSHRKAGKAAARQKAAGRFREVAEAWITHQSGGWSRSTRDQIEQSLIADVYGRLGDTPVADIRADAVRETVKLIEARGVGETAGRILQRIKAILAHAVDMGLLEVNPAADLKPSKILKARRVQHRAALPERELPAFLTALDAYGGDLTTKSALHLLVLTAVRPGELRGARWAEIDTDRALWRIPAERMKMGTEHLVPLSRQALEVLATMTPLTGGRELVFTSPYYPTKGLSENTLTGALARMGFKGIATAHGMRALFSTTANECGHDPDIIERQLAHVERDEVRAAYHRAQYLEQRAALMQWWADYLDAKKAGNVVPIGAARHA